MKLIHGIGLILVIAGIIAVVYYLNHLPITNREKELLHSNDSLRTANARLVYQRDSVIANIAVRDSETTRMHKNISTISHQHEESRVIIRNLPIDSLLRQQSDKLDDSI